jgi:LysM repeat protein
MSTKTYTVTAGFKLGETPLLLSGKFGDDTGNKLTAEIGDLTMVDIASFLIRLFDEKASFKEFPEPWGFLNKINFKGLRLSVESKSAKRKETRIGIYYPFIIDVGFAKIEALEIYYYPERKNISIRPYGTFIGKEFKEDYEIHPKQKMPDVPGYGSSLFDLKFLGMGQHISIKGMESSPSGIAETVGKLKTSFKKKDPEIVPATTAKKDELYFNSSSGWMIGTQFIIIGAIDLSIIYNDPYMYGLALSMSGAKAKKFDGLNIELLYKKVTDSIGVYSLHLKLPDAMRQLEFGAVSFTLPVIDIAIYSNGNFRVDLGFPHNNDWSRAATVQVFPFIGAGGFYFALLTGATATRLPSDYDPTTGVFKPVIDFGLALRLGIGKTIDKGILKAGISLCFQGVVTGTYGFFVPDPGHKPVKAEDSYYYLKGQFEVVGKIYGEINFSIISARLDVMIYAAIGMVIEAYKDMVLYVNAGVSLSLTVTIKLGFIKINVDFSFSTTISYTFVLPHGDAVPQWSTPKSRLLHDTPAASLNPYYISLVAPAPQAISIPMRSKRMLRSGKLPVLPIRFLPQFSARLAQELPHPELKDQSVSFVAALFLDSGKDNNAGDFGILARTYLEWLITNCKEVMDKYNKGLKASADPESVEIKTLKELFTFLSQDSAGVPVIAYSDLTEFLHANFDVQIVSPMKPHHASLGEVKEDFDVSIFPMLPDLNMKAQMDGQDPFVHVDFSAGPVDSSYNETLQAYFEKLKVGYQNPLEKKNEGRTAKERTVRQSLPTFIFQDYFILLGRNLVQDCIDLMEAYPYITTKTENLYSLQEAFKVTAAAIVNANATVKLNEGPPLLLGGVSYSIQKYDSFDSIAAYYHFENDLSVIFLKFLADDKRNHVIINLFVPGAKLDIPGKPVYECETGDTLERIAEKTKCDITNILRENKENTEILSTFAILNIPTYEFAIGKDATFSSLAALGNISLDQLAENNKKEENRSFFKKDTALVLPQLPSVSSMDVLTDGIAKKGSFRKLAGLASRYLMHGLRAPAPVEFTEKKNGTYALYDLTKQLFDIPVAATGACTITLSENKKTAADKKWFRVVPNNPAQNAIESTLVLSANEVSQVSMLSSTLLQPDAKSIKKTKGYTVNPARYMLKAPTVWQANAPVFVQGQTGATGPSGKPEPKGWWPYSLTGATAFGSPKGWKPAVSPKIWYFSDELTKAVQEEKSLEPMLRLYMGRNNAVEKKFEKKEVFTFGWSTVIPLTINTVPSSLNQGEDLSTMFEVESTSEEGLQLLENLLIKLQDTKVQQRVNVAQVHILYKPAATSDGAGLRSIDPSQVISAIVQSNLSTVRNPESVRLTAGSVGRVYESFNQDPLSNIRRLWEACSVRSGGFYLYYFDNNTAQGIPPGIFDDKGQAQISIVITYALPFSYGHNFVNSMAIGEIVPEDSYLFLESEPRQIVQLANDITVAALLNKYRLTLDQLADKLGSSALKAGGELDVRNIILLLSNNEYTAEKIAQKYNVSEKAVRDLNPGIEFKQGDAVRIPPVKYKVEKENESLNSIAAAYSVSVISLLWANREQAVFNDLKGLQLSDQLMNKTSSVVPGTVSFGLLRTNPDTGNTDESFDPEKTLQLNYNLLTYAVKENPSFAKSSYSMPVSPANTGGSGAFLDYQAVLPASSYSKPLAPAGVPSYPAPEKNPYRGTGDIIQVDLEWQDMYGNRTVSPFNAPQLYPAETYLNSFPQVIGYSDPLQSVLQWPSIGLDHLFLEKDDVALLNVSLSFDASGYQPSAGKGNWKALVEKAQADRETYRKAIYQLSAKDATATLSTSLAPSLAAGMKPGMLGMLDSIFHYLSAFAAPGYRQAEVDGTDPEALALEYRMSPEFIRALNPEPVKPDANTRTTSFLPNTNFYLYYTLSGESLTSVSAKLNVPLDNIISINPGVPEVPGDKALIVIPGYRFENYKTDKSTTLARLALNNGISAGVLKAANPDLPETIPAETIIFIPHFDCSTYTVQEGDTLALLAAGFNVPVAVLNAVTYRHTWPVQAGKTILVPDNDFILYTAKSGDTLRSVAAEKWNACETLRRINPALTDDLAAGATVLLAKAPAPLTQSVPVDFGKELAPVFALEVAITISRQTEQVDESFLDQPEVRLATCIVPPRLSNVEETKVYPGRQADAKTSASLLHYAKSFEGAFSDVKIATLGAKSASKNQLYAVRIHEGGISADKKTISYRFINGNVGFYAPIPLATYPLGATFRIPQYVMGKGFTGHCPDTPEGCMGSSGIGTLPMTFQGVQLDNIAGSLFESIDQVLQPDLTRGLLQIDGYRATNYRQQLLDAKAAIAKAYGDLVQPVMEETTTGSQEDAGEVLRQQMLQRLSNLYSIGTIVQLGVEGVSPATDATDASSLIFGNPVNKDSKSTSQVTFSSAQVNFDKELKPWMTFVLSAAQPEKNKSITVELAYKPLAMEFNIHPVPGINGYNASQWLFFVNPLAEVPIDSIEVPLPLRDFPMPPTPMYQEAKGVEVEDASSLTLEETRQWQYLFTFRNADAAAQDLVYSNTLFNIDNNNLRSAPEPRDLFLGLATWSVTGRDMMSDLLKYLPKLKPNEAENTLKMCERIVKSYLSVVSYVASALPYWLQVRALKYQQQEIKAGTGSSRNTVEFRMVRPEIKNEKDGETPFYIQLQRPEEPGDSAIAYPSLPQLKIGKFNPTTIAPTGEENNSTFYFTDEKNAKKYLTKAEAQADPKSNEVSVIFGHYPPKEKTGFGKWLDIMEQWNAWGGVYVTRNQYLLKVGDQPTNPNFVYRTPVVRPYNASAPLLDYDTPFNIHEMLLPAPAATLEEQLRNMLHGFFGGENKTRIRLKLEWSYSYWINPANPDQYVTLPGGLIPPFGFRIPQDWETTAGSDSFVCDLAAVIRAWLKEIPAGEAGACIRFDITAFSDLPGNKLPFYRLRNLFLNMKDVIL